MTNGNAVWLHVPQRMHHTLSLQSNLTEMIKVEEHEQSYQEEDETQGQPIHYTLRPKLFQIAIGHCV